MEELHQTSGVSIYYGDLLMLSVSQLFLCMHLALPSGRAESSPLQGQP